MQHVTCKVWDILQVFGNNCHCTYSNNRICQILNRRYSDDPPALSVLVSCHHSEYTKLTAKLNASVQVDMTCEVWQSLKILTYEAIKYCWYHLDYWSRWLIVCRLSAICDMNKYETLFQLLGNTDIITTQQCTLHCKLRMWRSHTYCANKPCNHLS